MAGRTLWELIADTWATARGTVLEAAVRSASTEEVLVLVFVDQGITNAVTPQPRPTATGAMSPTPHGGRRPVERPELT